MSKVFGEHKELRFLGGCANYEMKTYFDGVSFHFKNYLVHRNSDILLKGLKIKYCNCIFCETFFNFSYMEDLSEKIQKTNLSSKEVISGECLKMELTFFGDVIGSFYTVINGGDIDFDLTKNKVKIILPNSSTKAQRIA